VQKWSRPSGRRGITVGRGQCPVKRYNVLLLDLIIAGRAKPSTLSVEAPPGFRSTAKPRLMATTPPAGPRRLRHIEQVLRAFRLCGLDDDVARIAPQQTS
jgi:hypothetical protein